MCTWPAASRSLKAGSAFQVNEGIIQQKRRQKKRCSYGVRTVELERSNSGYGFTISGQYPCILSCIVSKSPAEKAGLRPGDYLIAVNNKNVSKSLHDDVVRLIGNSSGILKLQIADSYYSDSSEDELITVVRPKLKYPHRTKHNHTQIRAEKVVEDLHTGLLFKEPERPHKYHDYKNITDAQLLMKQTLNASKSNLNGKENCIEDEVNSLLYTSLRQIQTNHEKFEEDAIYRAVVGYLGTIEMPKDLQIPRLQAIRNCIRRLRIEKKVHILVLLSVYPEKVTLVNSRGMKIAEYPSEKITYSGIYANDKKFFGLVTTNERRTRSSCHVFIVESKMKIHLHHLQGPRSFNASSNLNIDHSCCEFPDTAEPILCAISSLYRNRTNGGSFGLIDVTLTNRSNTSSNSSNSDSGIGFKDDFHHQKDSVFIVHDNGPAHLNRMNVRSPATVSLNSGENRLTVRAMPNPITLNENTGRNSCSFERNSFHKYAPNRNENSKNKFRPSLIRPVIAITPKRAPSNLDEYKLSPKVYGVEYPNQMTGKDILAGTTENCYDSLPENGGDDLKLEDGSQEANPSEGPYVTSDSEADEVYSEIDKKWIRIPSLQSCKRVSPHSIEVDGISNCEEFVNSNMPSSNMMGLSVNNTKSINTQGSRVASWALSFDKLLEDPAGIHTFAMFLQREFSYENIRFWVACERYKIFAVSDELMKIRAKEIFQRHLGVGASEPVNIDSQAQQVAEENLDRPNRDIFIPAQKQIYNLMKFDCYLRFLKSPIYKDTLVKEISDEPLFLAEDDDLDPGLPYADGTASIKGQKDKLAYEERSRKSLLSWNRAKKNENGDSRKSTRRKNKDKKDDASDTHGSRSSLTSNDLATMQRYTNSRESLSGVDTNLADDGFSLCRILLPDESTAVVQTKANESVISILRNVMSRRKLDYTTVEVFLVDSNKTIDLYDDSRVLSNLEIRVEERIIFRVTLPNKKILILKNDCNQIIRDALRAVLSRYGFKMESVVVLTLNNEEINLNLPARNFDKQGILIDFLEKQVEWGANVIVRRKQDDTDSVLRLFDDIINEKVQIQWDEYGIWDTDKIAKSENKNTLERKAGILGVVRRNSLHFERDVKKVKNKKRASIHESVNHRIVQQPVTEKPPLPRVYKKEPENDDLYLVWERAQRSRLDDQRGTEINFEMPDFLKPQPKKAPLETRVSEPLIRTKYFDEPQKTDSAVTEDFSGDSVIPTIEQAEEFFSTKSAGYINFGVKDDQEQVLRISTRKSLSLIAKSKSSHQLLQNNNSTANTERIHHPHSSHGSFKLPLSSSPTVKTLDDSLSPSKIAPPSNINDKSLHVEEANFTPPPRLQLPTPPNTPPPLPPKPKYYPQRPSFGVKKLVNTSQDVSNKRLPVGTNNTNNDDIRSRRAMYIERDKLGDKFSISFV